MHVEHGSKQQNTCSFHELFFFFFFKLAFWKYEMPYEHN